MTPETCRQINNKRLSDWAARLTKAHATPLLVIAVAHDHKSGEIHVIRTEDGPTDAELAGFCIYAAEQLRAQE